MRKLFIVLLTVLAVQNLVAEPTLPLGEFSLNRLDGWEHKSFKGETRYELQSLGSVVVLKAESKAAGSGLFKEQRIDLDKTPVLNWSWRIVNRLSGLNVPNRGDFRQGNGRWHLLPDDGGTRLIFDVDLTPKYWLPPVFGPWLMKRKLAEEAFEFAQGLERLATLNCC
jgi:Protein of unknown function (DUF3047)